MTTLEASPVTIRLLSGITDPADRLDLNGHEAVHGPLRLPGRRDAGWSNRFVAALDESGLTGRGGAGFPTAQKLHTIRAQRRRPVVVVNAMEGEPASGKDHFLATRVPHLVLDGAALMARCLDASAVQICVPRGSRVAARSFAAAVAERARAGMREAPFEGVQPPARYVAGEESALANWLDGGESLPLFRPDRPAFPRVSGRPALVDNAETLAQVALIAATARVVSGSGHPRGAGDDAGHRIGRGTCAGHSRGGARDSGLVGAEHGRCRRAAGWRAARRLRRYVAGRR